MSLWHNSMPQASNILAVVDWLKCTCNNLFNSSQPCRSGRGQQREFHKENFTSFVTPFFVINQNPHQQYLYQCHCGDK